VPWVWDGEFQGSNVLLLPGRKEERCNELSKEMKNIAKLEEKKPVQTINPLDAGKGPGEEDFKVGLEDVGGKFKTWYKKEGSQDSINKRGG